MGGFDLKPKPEKKAEENAKSKHKAKRIGVRIDMTPMVDIAFLLLIFYMVTTVFSMPQSLELNLPPKKSPDMILGESRALNIWVDSVGEISWHHNKSEVEGMDLSRLIAADDLQSLLLEKNTKIEKLVTLLKLDPKCRYDTMVRIIDEIHLVEKRFKEVDSNWSYRFSIDNITEWEVELMAKAKKST